jgi:hypothetical protein
MKAKIESMWDNGGARTFRDEDGGMWRVAADAGDGTLAVEEILGPGRGPADYVPEDADVTGDRPCGILVWGGDYDDTTISRCSSHGENFREGTSYETPDGLIHATPSGWGSPEKKEILVCISCGEELTGPQVVPEVNDDAEWERQEQCHAGDCEWVLTRAWRVNTGWDLNELR